MSNDYKLSEKELEGLHKKFISKKQLNRVKKRFETYYKSDTKTLALLNDYKSEFKNQLNILNQGGDVSFAQDTAFNKVLHKYPKEKSSRQYEGVLYKHLKELEEINTKTHGHDPNFNINKFDSEKERVEMGAFAIEHFFNQKRKPTESEEFIVFCGFVYELKLLVLSQSDQFLEGQRFQIHAHERVAFKKSPELLSLPRCWEYWAQLDKKEKDKILTQTDSGPFEYNQELFFESYLKYLKKNDLMTTETTVNVSKSETQGVLDDAPKKRPKEYSNDEMANMWVNYVNRTEDKNPTPERLANQSEPGLSTWQRRLKKPSFKQVLDKKLDALAENLVHLKKTKNSPHIRRDTKKSHRETSLDELIEKELIEKEYLDFDNPTEEIENRIDEDRIDQLSKDECIEEILKHPNNPYDEFTAADLEKEKLSFMGMKLTDSRSYLKALEKKQT